MSKFELRGFQKTLELRDNESLVAAELIPGSQRDSSAKTNLALVEVPYDTAPASDDSEGVICGYETDSGPCQREVDSINEYCWQHP